MNKKILTAVIGVVVVAVLGGLVYYFQGGNLQGFMKLNTGRTIIPIAHQTPSCSKGIVYANVDQKFLNANYGLGSIVDSLFHQQGYANLNPENSNFGQFFEYMKQSSCPHKIAMFNFEKLASVPYGPSYSFPNILIVTCDKIETHNFSNPSFAVICKKGPISIRIDNDTVHENATLEYKDDTNQDFMGFLKLSNYAIIR